MAETETVIPDQGSKAEDIRATEAPPAPAAAPSPARPGSSLDDVARAALGLAMTKQDALSEATRARAAKMRPEIEGLKQAGETLTTQATASIPKPPDLPPPPSRQLSGFLAPRPNETPEASVAKFISAMSLLATGTTALVKGNARTSLAALTGALKGWQEGDAERADRQFEDWRAKTDTMLTAWNNQRAAWEDWFKASKLSYDQKVKGLELAMLADGLELDAAKVDAEGAKYLFEVMDRDAERRHRVEVESQRIAEFRADRLRQQAETERHNREVEEHYRREEKLKAAREEKKQHDENTSPFSDEDMENAARFYINDPQRRQPSFGLGASARPDRARFWRTVGKLAPEYGGVAGITARQASLSGLKGELATVMKTRGLVEAFSDTARKNLNDAERLSSALDRTGRPMIDRWLLAGRKAWSGEAAVVDFDVAVRTAINETARVLNSANASGILSDTARREIEDMLNTALNKEQFTAAVKRLNKEMDNRSSSYDNKVKTLQRDIEEMAKPDQQRTGSSTGWSIRRLD